MGHLVFSKKIYLPLIGNGHLAVTKSMSPPRVGFKCFYEIKNGFGLIYKYDENERMIKMSQELSRVLKMIETGIITAEEGQKLIQAIETSRSKEKNMNVTSTGHFLKLDILATSEGERENVQIKFPLDLAKVFLKLGIVQKQLKAKVGEEVHLNIEEVLSWIDSDVTGELMVINTNDAKIHICIE